MKPYKAWIKEITPLVYDNSKSFYEIISEIIPILIDNQTEQIDFANLMDTNKEKIETLINNIKVLMNDYSNTLATNIATFTSTYNTNKEDLINNINTIKENFISSLEHDIENYTTLFNSDKEEILQLITDAETTLNSQITTTLSKYYTEISNLLPDYLANDFLNDIYNIINNAFTDKYKTNQVNLWTELTAIGPDVTASEPTEVGIYVFNTTDNMLFRSENLDTLHWELEPIIPNGLYKLGNTLYQATLTNLCRTDDIMLTVGTGYINNFIGFGLDETIYAYQGADSGNYIITYTRNENGKYDRKQYGPIVFPEGYTNNPGGAYYTSLSPFTSCNLMEIDGEYYMPYNGYPNYTLLKSSDLINWEEVEEFTSSSSTFYTLFRVFETPCCQGWNSCQLYINGEWVKPNVKAIIGYWDYYIGIKTINNKNQLVQSSDIMFNDYTVIADINIPTPVNGLYNPITFGEIVNSIGSFIFSKDMKNNVETHEQTFAQGNYIYKFNSLNTISYYNSNLEIAGMTGTTTRYCNTVCNTNNINDILIHEYIPNHKLYPLNPQFEMREL